MELLYERSGGIIGRPFTAGPIDTATLPAEAGRQIETLVYDMGFFELPGSFGLPPSGAADLIHHSVTVTDADLQHAVSWHDLSEGVPAQLFELVGLVERAAAHPPLSPAAAPIFRHWVHSREEDVGDVQVYRPRDFPFPPSFGRDGFDIREDGTFIRHEVGPADEPVQVTGTWTVGRLHADFAGERPPRTLEVVSYDEEVLRIRVTPEPPAEPAAGDSPYEP